MLDHLPSPTVERGINHHVRAGRHEQIGALRKPIGVDQIPLQVKHGSLLKPRAHLVHADNADVRARIHRPRRQILVDRKMRSPCLIDDQRLVVPMADVGDGRNVRASAVRAGADDESSGRVWVPFPRSLYLFRRGWMGEVSLAVPPWGDPPRPHTGEDQPGDDRLVTVAGEEQPAVCPAGHGHHCGPHRQRATARGEEGRLRAHGIGHQFLCARQEFTAGHPIVERGGGEQVGETGPHPTQPGRGDRRRRPGGVPAE